MQMYALHWGKCVCVCVGVDVLCKTHVLGASIAFTDRDVNARSYPQEIRTIAQFVAGIFAMVNKYLT